MCSEKEASDRITFKELSVFECTSSTYTAHPRDRIPDPLKCVKKYRRNAAGGGVQPDLNIDGSVYKRSLDDLRITVDYLLGKIYVSQQSDGMREKESLLTTVNFIDDRIRAIQVDLTTLLGSMGELDALTLDTVRRMQVKLIRYNLLTQHLLSNNNADKYEWKFAHTAMTTCISSYFSTYHGHNGEKGEKEHLDEVMCYASLLHIASVLKNNETAVAPTSSTGQRCGLAVDGGSGMSAILSLYKKYVICKEGKKSIDSDPEFPKYQWALDIAASIENGDLLSALRLICQSNEVANDDSFDNDGRFYMLSRCCLAQAIPLLRIGLMRRYNKSFGKQEKVKGTDIASLLSFTSSEDAILFGQQIGLPISDDGGSVIMKAAPISIDNENTKYITNPGRSMDNFIFGKRSWLSLESPKPKKKDPYEGMSSLQRAMMQMKIENDPNEIDIDEDDENGEGSDMQSRIDQEGVLIFPSKIIVDFLV